jgi:3-oxoacyl-[acyl-carrier-protein] synthase II
MKSIYINGIGNISPQATFDQNIGTELAKAEGSFFKCQEPKYKEYIQSKLLRRMSRMVKMGLATAQMAMNEAKNNEVDAILTGTAWGCVKDTERFLETIIENDEQYLTPTAFVQSTHNTVGGQVALMHHNNCYNMTYVQGAVSFESALIDAEMQLRENQIKSALVGGFDEQTDNLRVLLERLKCANPNQPMGEGSTFFVLSETANENSYAKLLGTQTLYNPSNKEQVENNLMLLLDRVNLDRSNIDLVLTGNPKDMELFEGNICRPYKQLCGEYPTSTAFAMAVAANILKGDANYKQALKLPNSSIQTILIYNNHQDKYYSFILLGKCGGKLDVMISILNQKPQFN